MAKAKNWAIIVGINAYEHIGQLRYANRDAAALRNFFHEAKFDRVFYFADGLDIPPQSDQKSTQPRHSDLVDFLHDRFTTKTPPLSAGDNCWFFFAGHGKRIKDCDYLLPQDYNPRLSNHADRAIPVNFVREALLKSGADNVILLLDACRTEGDRADGLGIGDEQPGAITIFSCQRNQKAYEIEALQQGAFTAALLEGLRMPKASDNCATVQRLDAYLRRRVLELCRLHPETPVQTPATSVDPGQKWYLLLLPDVATEPDIAMLKVKAYEAASLDENLELAEQLWIRIIAATSGQDQEALRAYAKITRHEKPLSPTPSPAQATPATPPSSNRSTDSQSLPPPSAPTLSARRSPPTQPLSHVFSQPAQPVDFIPRREIPRREIPRREIPRREIPRKKIPSIHLMILGLLYAIGGMLLALAFASYGVGAISVAMLVAWAVAIFGAVVGAWARAGGMAVAVAVSVAMVGAWAGAGVGTFALVFALVMAGTGEKLLASFSRFDTFLILAGIPLVGLGVGGLGYWAFKATGH